MFEKRNIWGLIVGLNVCILICLISEQEPVMLDVNTAGLSTNNKNTVNPVSGTEKGSPLTAALLGQQLGNNIRQRDPLSSKYSSVQNNDDANHISVTDIGLNISNNSNKENSLTIAEQITLSRSSDVKTTTKTSDFLSSDIQSLTSSPSAGVVIDFKTKPTPSSSVLPPDIASALPDNDFNQLINLQNFQFLMPQPVCGNNIQALILVHSAPKNYEKRQIIRETWASITQHTIGSPLSALFLLGAVKDEQVQIDLQNENNIHKDIVQGSFIDDYHNMTYKHVMALKWFLYNCPHAQILIKVDDDVYVNTPQLIKYLKGQQQQQQRRQQNGLNNNNNTNNDNPTIAMTVRTNKTTTTTTNSSTTTIFPSIFHKLNIFASFTSSTSASKSEAAAESSLLRAFNASQELFNHPQNLMFCQKIIGSLAKRSYRSKWRVSFKEYSERYYPPYCPGYAIIYSPDVILRLYTAAQNSKYLWIDDVHVTGVLAQQTNTTITTSSHYVLHSDEYDKILTGKTDLSKTEFLFTWYSITAQKIKSLWHLQMMSLQSLNDLHYKKEAMSNVHKMQHQRQQKQNHPTKNGDKNFVNNAIPLPRKHTAANDFR